jgi:2,3-dihydroxyphenylpropionate 1,2-dioxygenase
LAKGVLERGVDLTISARMTVDHGFAQPLEVLFGGIDRVPVVPVFVNGVATPLCPMSRIHALGSAVGAAAQELDRRVLFVGSGGLSHDPPVPVLDGAPPRVANALIEGHPPTPEQRGRGESRVIQAGRDYAAGYTAMIPINPTWDNRLLDLLGE